MCLHSSILIHTCSWNLSVQIRHDAKFTWNEIHGMNKDITFINAGIELLLIHCNMDFTLTSLLLGAIGWLPIGYEVTLKNMVKQTTWIYWIDITKTNHILYWIYLTVASHKTAVTPLLTHWGCFIEYINGLAQDCSNSTANALGYFIEYISMA